jgi:hypothetical protein
MDPIALQDLVKVTGSLTDPVSGAPLGAGKIAKTVMESSYLRFPNKVDQDRYLGQLINEFWEKVKKGHFSGTSLLAAVSEAVQSQHLKIFSTTPSEESALARLDADGSYEQDGPNVQMMFTNNYSKNKVDYFLSRSIDTHIALQADGDASVTTHVALVNRSPKGPPSDLLGTGAAGVAPGADRTMLSVLLPSGSKVDKVVLNGARTPPLEYSDEDHPVPWSVLSIPPGKRAQEDVFYTIPNGAEDALVEGDFRFTLFPQATAHPDQYSIEVSPPPGLRIIDGSGKALPPATPLKLSGTLEGPVTINLSLTS